jgi:hypothetical protein
MTIIASLVPKDIRDMIAEALEATRAELARRLAAGTADEYVVVTSQHLRVGIKSDASFGVIACLDPENTFSKAEATRFAAAARNGHGEPGEAITFGEFLGRAIANYEEVLGQIDAALAKKACQ